MTKRKKAALGVLAVLVVAVAAACIVYVVRVPNLTIYFDSYDDEAYSMHTKTGVIKKIKLSGYDKISFATPFDGGYYCRAEKNGKDYFLMVQGDQVTGELPEPVYGAAQIVKEMCASDEGLYVSCAAGESTQKVLFVDFSAKQITELPLDGSQWQGCLVAQGSTVLLERDNPENGMCIYRYKNKTLAELTQGYVCVFLSETQFLYQTKDYKWMLYDLTTGTSQPATQKVNFDLYTSMMGWEGAPAVANGWLVGWRAGIPAYEATALVSGITVTNMDTGETYWLPTMLGRRALHLQAVAGG